MKLLARYAWVLIFSAVFPFMAESAETSDDYFKSGVAKQQKEDMDGAFADYTSAIELDPKASTAYGNRGDIKALRENFKGAIEDYTKALEIDPKNGRFYGSRGMAKAALKDLDGAFADYTHAIEIDPGVATFYNERGMVRGYQGDMKGALADFTKVIELLPGKRIGYNNRANVLLQMKDWKGALADLDKVIEIDPNPETYATRSKVRKFAGDAKGAAEDQKRAGGSADKVAQDADESAPVETPGAPPADMKEADIIFKRSQEEMAAGDYSMAITDLTRILEFKKISSVCLQRAQCYIALGQWGPASVDLQNVITLSDDTAGADNLIAPLVYIARKFAGGKYAENAQHDLEIAVKSGKLLRNNAWGAGYMLNQVDRKAYPLRVEKPVDEDSINDWTEHWFYAGMTCALEGDTAGADEALRLCLKGTAAKSFRDIFVKSALKTIGVAPHTATPAEIAADKVQAYLEKAQKENSARQHVAAVAEVDKALALDPKNIRAYELRADANKFIDDKETAEDYTHLIALNPASYKYYVKRGELKSDLKDYAGAIADFNTAIGMEPKYAPAYLSRSITRHTMGDKAGSDRDMNLYEAVKKEPGGIAY